MRPSAYVNELLQTIEAYRLGDRHPEQVGKILFMHRHGMLSDTMAQGYLLQIGGWIQEQESRPNLLARAPAFEELYPHDPPDIIIGDLEEAEDVPLGLSLTGNMNCIFAGRAGSGKTTGLRSLIHAICKHNRDNPGRFVSIIVWDRKGGDYADSPQLGPEWMHLGLDTLRIGLDSPEGVPPNIWVNAISTVFSARAGLITSAVCLANMMRFLLGAMNPAPSGGPLLWPSLGQLLELAKAVPLNVFAEKAAYEQSLSQMVLGATHAGGPLFETSGGLNIEREIVRLGRCAVLDVCGLGPPWVRAFASDVLNLQLLLGRQWRYERRSTINTVMVTDEADTDTDRKSEAAFADLSPHSYLLKQGREYGVAAALGISAVGPTGRQILTNASHYFFFSMSDAESLHEARQTLLLPPHAEGILPALEPGECLYRGPGPWPHAMLAKLHAVPSSRVCRPSRYDSHPFIPAQKLSELPPVQQALKQLLDEHDRTQLRQARRKQATLPKNARDLLDLASLCAYFPVTRLWTKIGVLSAAAQAKAKQELATRGLASFKDTRVSKRTLSLIWIEAKGWQLLGKPPLRRTGRGGIEHCHFCNWLKMWANEQGYKAHTEWPVPGTSHPADCAYELNGEWHAFEVVCESDNLIGHLEACFLQSQSVATVTIIAGQKGLLKDLQAQVSLEQSLQPFASRIKFDVIENFLPEAMSA
jgi:hypothetical protein